jgi:hypothetical protein
MSDEVAPVGASVLPEVDDVLADALTAQGEAGVRALGLLRDAHWVLTGEGFVRPAEVAAACVRSAADALLGSSGRVRRPEGFLRGMRLSGHVVPWTELELAGWLRCHPVRRRECSERLEV